MPQIFKKNAKFSSLPDALRAQLEAAHKTLKEERQASDEVAQRAVESLEEVSQTYGKLKHQHATMRNALQQDKNQMRKLKTDINSLLHDTENVQRILDRLKQSSGYTSSRSDQQFATRFFTSLVNLFQARIQQARQQIETFEMVARSLSSADQKMSPKRAFFVLYLALFCFFFWPYFGLLFFSLFVTLLILCHSAPGCASARAQELFAARRADCAAARPGGRPQAGVP